MAVQKSLLRGEQTTGRASLTETTLPAGATGPPFTCTTSTRASTCSTAG